MSAAEAAKETEASRKAAAQKAKRQRQKAKKQQEQEANQLQQQQQQHIKRQEVPSQPNSCLQSFNNTVCMDSCAFTTPAPTSAAERYQANKEELANQAETPAAKATPQFLPTETAEEPASKPKPSGSELYRHLSCSQKPQKQCVTVQPTSRLSRPVLTVQSLKCMGQTAAGHWLLMLLSPMPDVPPVKLLQRGFLFKG